MINGHPVPFPVFILIFVGGWLAMTLLLDGLMGWPGLQGRYPEVKEDQFFAGRFNPVWGGVLSRQSGLSVSAGMNGLRLAQAKIFAPFARPITVPWREIYAQRVTHGRRARLALGYTGASLTVDAQTWEALAPIVPSWPGYTP